MSNIERNANEWLKELSAALESDPDVIAATPVEELRAELLAGGIDPDELIRLMQDALGMPPRQSDPDVIGTIGPEEPAAPDQGKYDEPRPLAAKVGRAVQPCSDIQEPEMAESRYVLVDESGTPCRILAGDGNKMMYVRRELADDGTLPIAISLAGKEYRLTHHARDLYLIVGVNLWGLLSLADQDGQIGAVWRFGHA